MQPTLKKDIHFFLLTTICLMVIGFIFIYSASSVFALAHHHNPHYYVKKQAIGIILAFIALTITALLPHQLIKQLTPYAFIGSMLLMLLTLFSPLGVRIHGSARWLNIGFMNIQPGELLRLSTILLIVSFLSRATHSWNRRTYLFLLTILVSSSTVLLLQPDFGSAVTIIATTLFVLFIVGIPLQHLVILVSGVLPLALGLILYKPYRFKRILTYLNPWADPQGSGFQIIQSLIAIGSGHWLGSGISHSKQKFFYLPMQHTDFIFSIIAEETGFLGSLILIILYSFFLYYGLKLSVQVHSSFASLCITSFVLLLSLQASINIGVATGLLPTKGIGLPFISYGNSALIIHCMMIGIIINCIRVDS